MFTGIVMAVGRIVGKSRTVDGVTLTVAAAPLAERLTLGDSVAVNGVCQTVTEVSGDRFAFTAVGETLKKTTLGELTPGADVNLEPAATPDTSLGGHFVQGHVDGVGQVESFERVGQDRLLTVRLPQSVVGLAVSKGSVAIDGVSLTVVDVVGTDQVSITIIPFTVDHTVIGGYRPGTRVNVEADIIGKYVMTYLERLKPERSGH